MTIKTRYTFVLTVKPLGKQKNTVRIIEGQSVFQDELMEPYPGKGHLWDLKNDKCLVHPKCNCELSVFMAININLASDAKYIRSYSKEIKEAYDKRGLV